MTQRQAGSSATRARLVEAARECVRTGGLAGATSRQITATAGANLGAITYHFGSKDDLLAEALFTDLERRVRPVLEVFDADTPPTEALGRAVQQLMHELEQSRADTPIYLETLLLATRDARYRRSALRLYQDLAGRLADLMRRLIDEGTIPAWVEPEAMASLILAVANGIVLQASLDPDGPDDRAMATQFAGLLLTTAQR